MKVYVPPNGFVGSASQTMATQMIGAPRTAPARRKRATKKRAAAPARKRRTTARRATSSSKRPARLVKGSAAAKRYMASIRRKRKR